MATRSYGLRPRRGRRAGRVVVGLLALAWLAVGLVAAARYLDAYYQHRGFAQLKRPAGVPAGHVVTERFFSPALGHTARYLVYVPTHYDPARRYPVLYLLHGTPGRPENFIKIVDIDVKLDTLISRHRVQPMILVFPDGRLHGSTFSDTQWANTGRGNYESYMLDVVQNVDQRFPTGPVRTARAIGGYSEGGFGATNIALHHLDTFAGIESWSGYYVANHLGAFKRASSAQIAANSPLDYAAGLGPQLARYPLRAFFYGGTRDGETNQLPALVNELRAAGGEASYARYPGSHDWALWHAHVDQMLAVASSDFQGRRRTARALSGGAARRAAQEGARVAAAARILERHQAAVQAALLKVCRADATAALGTAAPDTVAMTPRGLRIVTQHLLYNCDVVYLIKRLSLDVAPAVLCQRLPATIGIIRPAARRKAAAITARCLSLADRPALPTPPVLSSPPPITPELAPTPTPTPAPPRAHERRARRRHARRAGRRARSRAGQGAGRRRA